VRWHGALYVRMSRALNALVQVGDMDVVRRIGDDEVAKRLNIWMRESGSRCPGRCLCSPGTSREREKCGGRVGSGGRSTAA
jgi:hypothetical protein